MSLWCGHRNISWLSSLSACVRLCERFKLKHLLLSFSLCLENHSLQSDASSSSSTSSCSSSSFRPSHGTSPSARALTRGHNLSLSPFLCLSVSASLSLSLCYGQEATERHSRGEPPVPPWQKRSWRDGGRDEKMTAGGNDTRGEVR